jgi:putative transposase
MSRGLSKRAVRGLRLSRFQAHYELKPAVRDTVLSGRIQDVTLQFPRFGYRRRSGLGLEVGDKRVWWLWSQIGRSLPKRRPRRRCCGSDLRLPTALRPNPVWSLRLCPRSDRQ